MNMPLFVHSCIDDRTDLTPNALRVYMHLARRADKAGFAWPSYQTVGDHCFSSVSDNPVTRRSMARKAIDELLAAGLISKENRQNDSGFTSNVYTMTDCVSIGIAMPQNSNDVPIDIAVPGNDVDVPIGTAMPHNPDPMPIGKAMPNGTKDTLIEDTPIEDTPDDDEDARVRDPFEQAWFDTFGVDMSPEIQKAVERLRKDCSDEAVIYAIREGRNAKSRSFKYIGQIARNYIPPPSAAPTYTNGYHLDTPGVHRLEPPATATPQPEPPPPLATDDPWAIALTELAPALPGLAATYLAGSRMENGGDLAGIPLYRIVIEPKAALFVEWLNKQAGGAIRRKLSSILRKRIEIEIVAMETEPA